MSTSFSSLATVTASTKRAAAISSGKRGTPTTNITSLSCTPLDPTSPDLRQRLGLQTAHEVLQTYAEGTDLDIKEGDILVVGGREYPIVAVGDWTYSDSSFKEIVVEDLKR